MLPFLQPKKISSVIIAKRKSDGSIMPEREEGEHSPGMMSAAEDMISAIHAKDAKAFVTAWKAMDNINDSEGDHDSASEHVEGE